MDNNMIPNNEEVSREKEVVVAKNKTPQQAIKIINSSLKDNYSENADIRRKYEYRYRPPPQPAGKKLCCGII